MTSRPPLSALLPALWLVGFCWFSIAGVNLGKALVLCLLPVLLWTQPAARVAGAQLLRLPLLHWMAAALALQLFSLLWTVAPAAPAFGAAAKYTKLLLIPALMLLLCDARVHKAAQNFWLAGGALMLALSYLAASGLLAAFLPHSASNGVVSSSYLDQSIMTACFAAVAWHLGSADAHRPWLRRVALGLALLALLNTVLVLVGRTGYVVSLALLLLALAWGLPRRYWALALAALAALALALFMLSGTLRERVSEIHTSEQRFAQVQDAESSTGARLFLWRYASQLIAERPVLGWGAGAWEQRYKAHIASLNTSAQSHPSPEHNTHEEYLQWGVGLGLVGLGVFMMLLYTLARQGAALPQAQQRAMHSVLLALGLACLFNSTLFDAFIGEFFCITLGLLLAPVLHHCPATAEHAAH